jgi:hypothetical protein
LAKIKPYVWDIVFAFGLFWLYLELKNINLVQNEENQLWADYRRRQAQQQQAAANKTTHAGGGGFFGLDLSGVGKLVGNLIDPLAGKPGVMG